MHHHYNNPFIVKIAPIRFIHSISAQITHIKPKYMVGNAHPTWLQGLIFKM